MNDIDAYLDIAFGKALADVSPDDRKKLRGIINHYRKHPRPFRACVKDNTKRFGPEGAKKVCAVIKDLIEGNTHWRVGKQRGEKADDFRLQDVPDEFFHWLSEITVEEAEEYARLSQGEEGKSMNGAGVFQKIRSAKFKALDKEEGAEPGTFSAVVAVYGNVDKVGDRIVEGAFDRSLEEWKALGDPIPIVLAHEWKDPFAHIGYVMPDKLKSAP